MLKPEVRPAGLHASRGEMIGIGPGRRLRAIRAGEGPLAVVLESGAFGCAADWAVVQDRLAARGLASLAYDRAGLGFSDPGPKPREATAIAADLEALLAALGETGRFVIVGHSMGGLLVRVFAQRNLERLQGVVLVDAVVPELLDDRLGHGAVHAYRSAMKVVGLGADVGFMRPVSLIIGDLIGLEGEARDEKRRIYGSRVHTRWAAEEVQHLPASAELARARDWPEELPIAVVTAGSELTGKPLKLIQSAPARASRHGYIEHVAGANHASLLGRRFADPIVRGVEHVLAVGA